MNNHNLPKLKFSLAICSLIVLVGWGNKILNFNSQASASKTILGADAQVEYPNLPVSVNEPEPTPTSNTISTKASPRAVVKPKVNNSTNTQIKSRHHREYDQQDDQD